MLHYQAMHSYEIQSGLGWTSGLYLFPESGDGNAGSIKHDPLAIEAEDWTFDLEHDFAIDIFHNKVSLSQLPNVFGNN